jgi:quercetin dioxygenase-like cupin family protein
MHIFRASEAERVEPAGHFGHLAVADVVPKSVGDNFVVQLSYCPPGGGGEKHHHDKEAQLFLVIQGELTFDTGEDRFTLREQEAVLFEPFEPHATLNESDSDSVAVVVTVNRS